MAKSRALSMVAFTFCFLAASWPNRQAELFLQRAGRVMEPVVDTFWRLVPIRRLTSKPAERTKREEKQHCPGDSANFIAFGKVVCGGTLWWTLYFLLIVTS